MNNSPIQFSGVVPSLALSADLGPPRTECGVGGLMPWNGRLYIITYLSHTKTSGSGSGLYWIDETFQLNRCPESVPGTYANRFVHYASNQLIIGPHLIDAQHRVRTIDALVDVRICSTMQHLTDPENLVYLLGMEGEFIELNVHTLEHRQLFDLNVELDAKPQHYSHFKAAYTAFDRVVVANNSYDEKDFSGEEQAGRLAEWDGKKWTVLSQSPFYEVIGRGGFGRTIFATGWDRASALLKVFTSADRKWRTYRLPKATQCFEHMWQTEWPRIREVEHERMLMDCHGMFYELTPWAYGNVICGVKPISSHLWVHGDFCSWRGLLVLGPDNASPANGENHLAAEPQSGMWFGKTDDLWQFGKPSGWGGPWWQTPVRANEPSDPYLLTGFDKKCMHLASDSAVKMRVEVDFCGNGTWNPYQTIGVSAGGYAHHEFPSGFSAHWLRIVADQDCVATAHLHYT